MDNNEQDYNQINNDNNNDNIQLEENKQEQENQVQENSVQNAEYNYCQNNTNGNFNNNIDYEKKRIDEKAHNMAIASLILGIISIVLCCCCSGIITLICGIVGIVLWYNAKDSEGNREGMAKAGMICSIIGIVLSIIVFIAVIVFGVLGSLTDALSDL